MRDTADAHRWQAMLPRPSAEHMAALRWRMNRLRCMTPGEIVHRLGRLARLHAERLALFVAARVPAPNLTLRGTPWIAVPPGINGAPYVAAAERVLNGRFDVFALHDIELGTPPRWNRDPKTGIEAPTSFGKLLDYRDPRLVGDIKYLWEPNRHLHLVVLAQAYAIGGELRYLDTLRSHLDSWFAACPPGQGANWSSALEAGLRLINWSHAWQLVGGLDSPLFAGTDGSAFRRRWLDSIYRHARFVRGHLSLHSSANNHLLGEASGLFVAAVTWPHWPRSRSWRARAQTLLEREVLLQTAPDGVNREQATAYQQFVLDLLLVPLLAARANGIAFAPSYEKRIEAMLGFLASIMDSGGHLPAFGDADDGAALALEPGVGRAGSQLATGAILFRRGEFKAKAGPLDDATRWLLGAGANAAYRALTAAPSRLPVRQDFPDGGYYVLGRDFEGAHEIRLVADAGPLGYLGIAAHGHADALSFTLAVGGLEFFVDPGTYAYHTQGPWRAYFRGTAAHNTVRIDGRDQSEPGGNFMWLDKARAACNLWRSSPVQDVFEGWHDGYLRLPDPVRHTRRIVLDKSGGRIVVEDVLQMEGTHDVELFFHCSEHCRIHTAGKYRAIGQHGRTILLRLPELSGATTDILRGSTAPIAGWISRRFDERHPAPTLRWRALLTGTSVLRSEIVC